MATLVRVKTWIDEVLTFTDLNAEINNLIGFWNAFGVTSPMSSALDASSQLILNPRFRSFWQIANAAEFDTVQAAIDSITNGIVFVPAGTTIDVGSTITMKSNVFLVGQGYSSILRNDTITTSPMISVPAGVSNSGVMNLQLDGNNVANTAGLVAILALGSDLFFDRVWGNQWGDVADGLGVSNEIIELGVNATRAARVWISRCKFTDVQRDMIRLVNVEDIFMSDLYMDDGRSAGINSVIGATSALKNIFIDRVRADSIAGDVMQFVGTPTKAAGVPDLDVSGIHVNDVRCRNVGTMLNVTGVYLSTFKSFNGRDIAKSTFGGVAGMRIYDSEAIQIIDPVMIDLGDAVQDDVDGIQIGVVQAASEKCRGIKIIGGFMDDIARHGVFIDEGGGAAGRDFRIQNLETNAVNVHDATNLGSGIRAEESAVSITDCTFVDLAGVPRMLHAIHAPVAVSSWVVIGNTSQFHQGVAAFHDPTLITGLADGNQAGVRESNLFI